MSAPLLSGAAFRGWHTPGPWNSSPEFVPGPYHMPSVRSIFVDGMVLAHVNCAFGDGDANAKLIEASPAMAEALRYVLKVIRTDGDLRQAEQIAAAALAKAGMP